MTEPGGPEVKPKVKLYRVAGWGYRSSPRRSLKRFERLLGCEHDVQQRQHHWQQHKNNPEVLNDLLGIG